MERYDSYKDSEVQWVFQLPIHWNEVKPWTIFQPVKRDVQEGDEIITCFRDGIVTLRKNRREDGFTNSLKEIGYQRILKGDLVVHEMDGFAGSIGVSDSVGKSTPVYTVIPETPGQSNRYWMYLLREMSRSGFIESLSKSIRERTTEFRWKTWKDQKFPIPPLDEQVQIVEYLDRKTNLIDSLIEKTVRKIDLLKEKRTSLINEVVTKGLNPDVEMKDSGVEWTGEIPSHWGVTKVKFNFIFRGGSTPSTEVDEYWNGDIPWVSSKDVKTKFIHDTEDHVSSLGVQNSSCSIIPIDSLIVVVRSGILQRTIPMSINKVELVVNQDQKVMISKGRTTVEWFYYFVKGNENRLLKNWVKEGTTVESIEMDKLSNHPFGLPPLHEQEQIVEYLDEQTSIIDSTITTEEKRIELLKEYRQSLISEVVTGKVKVTRDE